MNTLNVTGRIGQDPELREVGNDKTEVMNFSIFVKEYKKGDPNAGFWLNVTHFKPNDYLKDFCKKGVPVAISGRLNINKHKENYYTKLLSNSIEVFPKAGAATEAETTNDDKDDLPF